MFTNREKLINFLVQYLVFFWLISNENFILKKNKTKLGTQGVQSKRITNSSQTTMPNQI